MSWTRDKRNALGGYLLLSPSVITLLVVVVFPLLYVVVLSFGKFQYGKWVSFNGLNNYKIILGDPNFYAALKATLIFTVGSVIGQTFLAITFAMIINSLKRTESGVRLFIILPYMVSMVAGGVTFRWMLNTEFGIINHVLLALKIIAHPINYLGEPTYAMISLIVAHLWSSVPFATLIILAGLKSISTEIYESAELDGAGFFRCFFSITMPLIRSQLYVVMLIQTMFSFRHFPLPYSMTGGGPGTTTKVLAMMLKEKMTYLDYGYNSGLSVLMMAIIMVIAAFYLKLMSRSKL
ncbi:MAG: sugar ABC transporter permease [Sphaerochaeta sp.]|nr:sugar ABC transporter permease [Sphaerochaeta sp.]